MCLDCGCGDYPNQHHDPRHITTGDVHRAAEANQFTFGETVTNMEHSLQHLHTGKVLDAMGAFVTAATRPLIVSDIDNWLAFYSEAALQAVNARFGKHYRIDQWTTYHGPFTDREHDWLTNERNNDLEFFSNMAPDFHAIDALDQIADMGYTIQLKTNRPESVKDATLRWLGYWAIHYSDIVLHGPDGVHQIAALHNEDDPMVLIDDNPARWLDIPGPGKQVWSPRREYTPVYPPAGVRIFEDCREIIAWCEANPLLAAVS